MWIYFDASMIATTRVYDTPIRQGDIGDELFVVFANYNTFANKFVTLQIEYPNGSLSPEVFLTAPSSKLYGLASAGFFVNGTTYQGAAYTFADNSWFEQYGIHKITMRVYDDVGGQPNQVETTGLFNFNVEKSVFTPDPDVSLDQYQYLLSLIQGLVTPTVNTTVAQTCRNDELTTLTTGTPVYVSGTTGASGVLKVKRASASIGIAQPNKIFGVVADPITSGQNGLVIVVGLVEGFNTNAFTAGSNVYLGTTAGTLVATAPAQPNHRIIVGIAERIQTNTGSMYVRIQMGLDLGELCDVNTSASTTGDIIRKDASNVWVKSNTLTTAEANIVTNANNISTTQNNLSNHINNLNNPHQVTKAQVGLGNADNTSDANKPISSATQSALNLKADLVGGKVPSAQLPGGVDDIKEFADLASFPLVGEASIIYVALNTNIIYRWSGSTYVEISSSLALGETASTAYRGDRGKIAYDYSQVGHVPLSQKAAANGVATLDASSKVPLNQLPDLNYTSLDYELNTGTPSTFTISFPSTNPVRAVNRIRLIVTNTALNQYTCILPAASLNGKKVIFEIDAKNSGGSGSSILITTKTDAVGAKEYMFSCIRGETTKYEIEINDTSVSSVATSDFKNIVWPELQFVQSRYLVSTTPLHQSFINLLRQPASSGIRVQLWVYKPTVKQEPATGNPNPYSKRNAFWTHPADNANATNPAMGEQNGMFVPIQGAPAHLVTQHGRPNKAGWGVGSHNYRKSWGRTNWDDTTLDANLKITNTPYGGFVRTEFDIGSANLGTQTRPKFEFDLVHFKQSYSANGFWAAAGYAPSNFQYAAARTHGMFGYEGNVVTTVRRIPFNTVISDNSNFILPKATNGRVKAHTGKGYKAIRRQETFNDQVYGGFTRSEVCFKFVYTLDGQVLHFSPQFTGHIDIVGFYETLYPLSGFHAGTSPNKYYRFYYKTFWVNTFYKTKLAGNLYGNP